jgi:succinyl-diaminopimelate desuccinylase
MSRTPPDLVDLTTELVSVPSVSGDESNLATLVHKRLASLAGGVHRSGNNVIFRGSEVPGRTLAVLAGHLDTVPPQGNQAPRLWGGRLFGIGSTDMKAGLAVMLALARDLDLDRARFDLAFVFYECEEVAFEKNGLRKLWTEQPWLTGAGLAIILEPTDCAVELGCMGSVNAEFTARGRSAHSARPWLGENALYKALPLLAKLAAMEPRPVRLGGVTYYETLQVTQARAGIGRNVIPDAFTFNVNHRFAPSRSPEEVVNELSALTPEGFDFEVVDLSPPAPPRADHPLVTEFVDRFGLETRAKQAWTDVAQFAERGVPALNFGPGIPELAHRPDESVPVANLDRAYETLRAFLSGEPGAA